MDTTKVAQRDTLFQSNRWPAWTPLVADDVSGALPVWSLRVPGGLDDPQMRDEVLDVIEEILPESMTGGCYNLDRVIKPGERWVDVGCHVGVFSIAAMMHGASIVQVIDADPAMTQAAKWNVENFSRIAEALQSLPQGSIHPPLATDLLVEDAYDLDGQKRDGVKIDIQGHEEGVIFGGGASVLAASYNKLVMEWHAPSRLGSALVALDNAGWYIDTVASHEDILLNTKTHIIYAKTR